jgi:cytoskeletal protein CcmA (bactofilin family)
MLKSIIKRSFFGSRTGNFDKFNGILPKGVTAYGKLTVRTRQTFIVAGDVFGDIETEVELDATGRSEVALVITGYVTGNITGFDHVLIDGGEVSGNVTLKRMLVLRGKAHLRGDAVYGDLAIESGSIIDGKLQHYVEPAKAAG